MNMEAKQDAVEELASLLEKRTMETMKRNPHLDSLAKMYYEEMAIEFAQELHNAGYRKPSPADAKGGLMPLDVEKVAKEMWLNAKNFKTKLHGSKDGQYNAVTFREFRDLARIVCSKFGTAHSKDVERKECTNKFGCSCDKHFQEPICPDCDNEGGRAIEFSTGISHPGECGLCGRSASQEHCDELNKNIISPPVEKDVERVELDVEKIAEFTWDNYRWGRKCISWSDAKKEESLIFEVDHFIQNAKSLCAKFSPPQARVVPTEAEILTTIRNASNEWWTRPNGELNKIRFNEHIAQAIFKLLKGEK